MLVSEFDFDLEQVEVLEEDTKLCRELEVENNNCNFITLSFL